MTKKIKSLSDLKKLLEAEPNAKSASKAQAARAAATPQTSQAGRVTSNPDVALRAKTSASKGGATTAKAGLDHSSDQYLSRSTTRAGTPQSGGVKHGQGSIDVIIGLDFGTRYTKVCYRFYGDEKDEIAERSRSLDPSPFWPSRIYVDAGTGVVHAYRGPASSKQLYELSYLKMRLKDPSAGEFAPHPRLMHLIRRGSEQALAAFYLATVLYQACATIESRESNRIKGRQLNWQVNLSIPAQYQNDGVSETFRVTGEVALLWSQHTNSLMNLTVSDLCRKFDVDVGRVISNRRVEVFAEIVAALHHFIRRSDTPEGIHGFLDIGAGTLDGCIFELVREKAGRKLRILGAKVAPLGTIAISKKAIVGLFQDLSDTIEKRIVTAVEPEIRVSLPLVTSEKVVRSFVGELMASARDRAANRTLKQPTTMHSSDPTRLTANDRFVMRCSGGGATSPWYKRTIEGAHAANNHKALGIMPYTMTVVQPSSNYSDRPGAPFSRFVIAHGLSHPAEEIEEIRYLLPSQIGAPTPLQNRQTAVIDYLSTKDMT